VEKSSLERLWKGRGKVVIGKVMKSRRKVSKSLHWKGRGKVVDRSWKGRGKVVERLCERSWESR